MLNPGDDNDNNDSVITIDFSLADDGSSRALSANDQLRLRAVFARMRADNNFKKDPTVSDHAPITISYKNANRQRVTETVKLSHRILMRPSAKHGQRFQIGAKGVKSIGEGSFGLVRHARRYLRELNDGTVDIKTVSQVVKVVRFRRQSGETNKAWQARMQNEQHALENEIKIMSAEHKHVKQIVRQEYQSLARDGTPHEFVRFHLYMPNLGPELWAQYNDGNIDISFERICVIGEQLFKALDNLHQKQRVHMDIKLANVLGDVTVPIDEMEIALIDFGLALHITDVDPTIGGSPAFTAFEVLQGHFDYATDIYSAGVLMAILFGLPPAQLKNKESALRFHHQWLNVDLTKIPNIGSLDNAVKAFLSSMVAVNPHERPSAKACMHFFRYIRPTLSVVAHPAVLLKSIVSDSAYWQDDANIQTHRKVLDDLFDIIQNPARIEALMALSFAVGDEPCQHIIASSHQAVDMIKVQQKSKVNALFQKIHGAKSNLAFLTMRHIHDYDTMNGARLLVTAALKNFVKRQPKDGLMKLFGPSKNIWKAKMFIDMLTNARVPVATRSILLYCLLARKENCSLADEITNYDANANQELLGWVKSLTGLSDASAEAVDKLLDDIMDCIDKRKTNPLNPKSHFNLQQHVEAFAKPVEKIMDEFTDISSSDNDADDVDDRPDRAGPVRPK